MKQMLNPPKLMSISSMILLLLLSTDRNVDTPELLEDDHDEEDHFNPLCLKSARVIPELDSVTSTTLYSVRISIAFAALDDELRYWVSLVVQHSSAGFLWKSMPMNVGCACFV